MSQNGKRRYRRKYTRKLVIADVKHWIETERETSKQRIDERE